MDSWSGNNSGGSARNGTGRSNSWRNSSSSSAEVMRTCTCGREVVVRTSWTTMNPGRRFRGCPGDAGKYCGTFQWVDPPMCRRSLEVIPGLLNRINQYDARRQRAQERFE
ncbi:hypothetical protein Salat_0225700 [Sesamum alatum]|uniref:GRF-type domain-containing protein n=1 Tax=Sesamum alatum TaxID=300844 RepID=A0AAE1YZ36_9LAMI|nr:hypothetical protein Salat_0225700 [Sesamum alatum]